MVKASFLLEAAFVALPLIMLVLLIAGLRRTSRTGAEPDAVGGRSISAMPTARGGMRWAAGAIAWLAMTGVAARAGVLTFGSVPPTMAVAVGIGLVLSVRLGLSRTGGGLAASVPLALLVVSQAFRLPLEIAMHRAWSEGLMPVQMSYSGLNFDVVAGTTALVLGVVLAFRPVSRVWVAAWNGMGLVLLTNIVVISILSAPVPFRVFMSEPANVWITTFPFVWLPTVLVPAALLGHVLVWRRLRMEGRQAMMAAAPRGSGGHARARQIG